MGNSIKIFDSAHIANLKNYFSVCSENGVVVFGYALRSLMFRMIS